MEKRYLLWIVIILLFVSACDTTKVQIQEQPQTEEGIKETVQENEEPKTPSLEIISPGDGDLIKSSRVGVQLKAENFEIAEIGSPVKANEGHFHIWLDSNKVITTNDSAVFENVASGKHAIVAELVKSDHSSLNPKVIRTINVNVESDIVQKAEENKAKANEFTVEADDDGFYPDVIKAKANEIVKINFKFRDASIYFAGLDIKGPFEIVKYKLKGEQPITREFTLLEETKIVSYWPASGVKKATLIVEVEE